MTRTLRSSLVLALATGLCLTACDPKPEPTVAPTPSAPPQDPFNPPPPPEEPDPDPNLPDPAEPVAPDDEDVDPNGPIDPTDPLADMDEPSGAATGTTPSTTLPPLNGDCRRIGAPKRVWSGASQPAIIATADAFVVAGYQLQDATERVFVVRVAKSGLPQPLSTLPIAHPSPRARLAPPGLAATADGSVILATIDGQGALSTRTIATDRPGGTGVSKPIAQGVDTRFSPAVTSYGQQTLIAWTDGRGTPMRVWTTRIDARGTVAAPTELTQTAMGAAAPTFIDGSHPPELLFVDPRAGISTLVRVGFKADGTPGEPQVVVPLNALREPPQITGSRGGSVTWAAFTAIGNAATTAVGLLSIEPTPSTPEALVPGTAYGALRVASVATPNAAIFAADTPTAPGKDTLRRVFVTRVADNGRGAPTSLEGPGGGARNAAIARGQDGTIAVAFDNDSGVYVAFLRCDSSAP